ncbi:hypothetical protein D3C87_1977300 [compost metagenome]
MRAAPAERRLVPDLAAGRKQECARVKLRAAQDLPERDQAVEEAGARAAGHRDARRRKADDVAFIRKVAGE